MVSKLSQRIENLDLRLRKLESAHQDITFKAVLELTSCVHELSRKIDQQQAVTVLQHEVVGGKKASSRLQALQSPSYSVN